MRTLAGDDPTATASVPWYQSIVDDISKVGQAYLTWDQSKQLNALNIERAKKGLPALDASQYQMGLNVGVSSGTQNTVLIVAGVLGAAWILSSLARRS